MYRQRGKESVFTVFIKPHQNSPREDPTMLEICI